MTDIIDINTLFGPWPAAATDLGVDELLTLLGRHGIQSVCTLSTVGLLLDHNAGNSATRAACSEDARLLPAATINPNAFFGGDGPHTRFKADGYKLVRLFPSVQCWDPESASFVALAKALALDPIPIMIDIDNSGMASRLIRSIGDHPIPIILAGVDENILAEAICLKRAHSNVYLETSGLLAEGAIKFVTDSIGSDRLLYGSGAPARPMAGALGVLKHAGLGEAESQAVLRANAKRLLGL